jgi:dTDP-glucose 4,6-dehydratase
MRGCLPPVPSEDLDHVLVHTRDLWDELRGKRLFITGGTGFFGCWLLETFVWANKNLSLGASATVLTRSPDAFKFKAPHLTANPAVKLHRGDVRSFEFPTGQYSHIIHAAAESSARLNAEQPLTTFDTIVQGTRHVLDFAIACKTEKLLFTSSGAIYGLQPPELAHIPEDYPSAPDTMNPGSAYGEGKRAAELLCRLYAAERRLQAKIARCFAFVGPHLPLDIHYAIGNFIRDGLGGGPIRVAGDGTRCHSYLHTTDLAIWLWTILLRGESSRPYNVGSEDTISVLDLARTVARLFGPDVRVEAADASMPGRAPERYVPNTQFARVGLGLRQSLDLEESLRRTIAWCRQADAHSRCAPDQPSRPRDGAGVR